MPHSNIMKQFYNDPELNILANDTQPNIEKIKLIFILCRQIMPRLIVSTKDKTTKGHIGRERKIVKKLLHLHVDTSTFHSTRAKSANGHQTLYINIGRERGLSSAMAEQSGRSSAGCVSVRARAFKILLFSYPRTVATNT